MGFKKTFTHSILDIEINSEKMMIYQRKLFYLYVCIFKLFIMMIVFNRGAEIQLMQN